MLILEFAALVIQQVNSFGSLPHRKNHSNTNSIKKPIRRSKSDASAKKSKRNSIFNIFNSSANTQQQQPQQQQSINTTSNVAKANNINNNNKIKVARSKSDVSATKRDNYRKTPLIKLNTNNNNNSNEINETSDSAINKLLLLNKPLTPITEVNTPLLSERVDYFDKPLINHNNNNNKNNTSSNSAEDKMHSSQKPVDKLALTKGLKVDKMVKRLSIEKSASPPLQIIQAGGFSYTNPTSPTKNIYQSDIVYTQVASNEPKDDDNSNVFNKNDVSLSSTATFNRNPTTTNTTTTIVGRDEVDNFQSATDDEPIIKPNIREQIPRYSSNTNLNNNHFVSNAKYNNDIYLNNLDKEFDMFDEEFHGVDTNLSARRKTLESRIKSRINGLHHMNNSNSNNGNENNNICHSIASTPTTIKQHHYNNNNNHSSIVNGNRYSPERSARTKTLKSYHRTSIPHDEHKSIERNDSGVDMYVPRRSRKGRLSSRFNIG
jgi:hypothetical protein